MINEREILFKVEGNTPSSKNSRRNFGRVSLPSKATVEWKRHTKQWWIDNKDSFLMEIAGLEFPISIGVHFVRKSRRKFDWINMCQVIFDEMTKQGWIEDDNMDQLIPYPLKINDKDYTYDKDNPSTIFKVIKDPKDLEKLKEVLNINTK